MRSPLGFAISLASTLLLGIGVSWGTGPEDIRMDRAAPVELQTPICPMVPERPLAEPAPLTDPSGSRSVVVAAHPACSSGHPGLLAV